MKRISLVLSVCFFFGFGNFVLAQENSPHFFGKNTRPEAFFQEVEPMEFHLLYFCDNDSETLFERIEKSAKRLFSRKLEFSFFLNNDLAKKFTLLGKVERIRIEIDIIFKEEDNR